MYLAQCTSCAVEQSFEWKPGVQCFDCGGACEGAMICPDCFEPKNTSDLSKLAKKNSKVCSSCSSPYPELQDWREARIISRFYGRAKNISWDEKFSRLFVDHREAFSEWAETYAGQIDQLKAEFSHLDQFKPLFKTQFYRYGFTNHLLRGLPTNADTFVDHYKNWFSKLDDLNQDGLEEFTRLSRYHAPLYWLGLAILLKQNIRSRLHYDFRIVFDKSYGLGKLAMAEAASIASNWRYRQLLGLDDAGKYGSGAARSLLSEECLDDLLPLVNHPHYGDWVLLSICQWLKAYSSKDNDDTNVLKELRSNQSKLLADLNQRRIDPKSKMPDKEALDFKISAALLVEDLAFISTVPLPEEKNLREVLTKFIIIRSDKGALNIPAIKKEFESLDDVEKDRFLTRTIDKNEDVLAKIKLGIEFLRDAQGPIRDKLLYFIENISEGQLLEASKNDQTSASALVIFDQYLAPDYQLNTVELLRIGAHANRLKNLPDFEIFTRKLLRRTIDVLRTEYPTPESLLSLMSSTDYHIKKWFTEAVIERACELGDFDTIGDLAISPGIRRHMAQMFRDFDSSFVEKTVPALMSFASKITNDEDPETIKTMRETWIADLLRSDKKADVLSGLAGLYARSSLGRRPLIGLAGDKVSEIAGILEFQGVNFWENPSQVISEALSFDGFRLLNWTFMTLKQLPNHRFESFVTEMANLVTSHIPKEGPDVLDAYIRISEDLQSRASNLGPATSKRIADAISGDLSSLIKKLKGTGHLSTSESREKQIIKIIAEVLDACAQLEQDAKQETIQSKENPSDNDLKDMAQQQAEIAAQVQASAHAALEIGNQMAVMAKYQADMAALMARSDLSPLERAEAMQKLAGELQKKMS